LSRSSCPWSAPASLQQSAARTNEAVEALRRRALKKWQKAGEKARQARQRLNNLEAIPLADEGAPF
jgi:hypothetical protein